MTYLIPVLSAFADLARSRKYSPLSLRLNAPCNASEDVPSRCRRRRGSLVRPGGNCQPGAQAWRKGMVHARAPGHVCLGAPAPGLRSDGNYAARAERLARAQARHHREDVLLVRV